MEDTKVFDIVFRGFDRLKGDLFGSKDINRRLNIFYLSVPTVAFNTSRFLISNYIYDRVSTMAKRYVSRKSVVERTRFHAILPELLGTMVSVLASDVILYPIETVIHRLYIQGLLV